MNVGKIKETIKTYPNFPKEGIMFRDITPVFNNPEVFKDLSNGLIDHYRHQDITKVLGIESRGFVLGSIIAKGIGAGFVPVRKPGKLPGEVISQSYTKEYGEDTLEISKGSIGPDDIVLIHDDLFATGGTVEAVINLCKQCGVKEIFVNCVIGLDIPDAYKKIPMDVHLFIPIIFDTI